MSDGLNHESMNKPVDVICYGDRMHFDTRKEALSYFMTAMFATEGAESERYMQIYDALFDGDSPVVSDGEPTREKAVDENRFVHVKDKIVELIKSGELNIYSSEVYDMERGRLVIEDRDIIKALLKQDGSWAAKLLREYVENDKELLMDVALGGDCLGGALTFANETLRDEKDFVLEILKIDASDIQHVSDRLANDPDVVFTAFKHAKTEYDMDCIKESVGNHLFARMLASFIEKDLGAKGIDSLVSAAESRKKLDRGADLGSAIREDR